MMMRKKYRSRVSSRVKCKEKISLMNKKKKKLLYACAIVGFMCCLCRCWLERVCVCAQFHSYVHKMAECFSNSQQWVSPLCCQNIVKKIVYILTGHEKLCMGFLFQNRTKGDPRTTTEEELLWLYNFILKPMKELNEKVSRIFPLTHFTVPTDEVSFHSHMARKSNKFDEN